MLDQTTKRKLDSARQILVGKVPDPKAQVEQITTALVYKFMDDMDKESEELGGESKFFTNGFSQYSWTKLLDNKLSGQERLDLYVQAITNMSKNPHIPQLFRDIFKGAFLPYNDPRTLSLFLKEINEFNYEHSENLGNAFEYLLSILGSQGDAGQFRTPRHIIDFIVEVVDPKKNETILDPACGTAGFLISAYKHILRNNPSDKGGKGGLTPGEKLRLMNNLAGYDISDDMVKLSLVNMYLHGFPEPKIFVYDTLSSEKRWDETFDVILANPPFMSPSGGIVPHKKFSIQATRAEVLFVDYIVEHLNINGRAGIIIPEGVIFKNDASYKQLRKTLIEDGLYAVVSLPPGVFNPYSGVKTNILFFDNNLAKKTDEILFIKVLNDGFDLGAQRRPRPDMPNDLFDKGGAIDVLNAQRIAIQTGSKNKLVQTNSLFCWLVKKEAIAKSGDYRLSGDFYKEIQSKIHQKWPTVELGEVLDYEQPTKYIVNSVNYNDDYPTPVLTAGKTFILGHTNEKDGIFNKGLPVIIFDDFTTAIKFVDFPFKVKSSAMKILHADKNKANIRFIFHLMRGIKFTVNEHKRYWISEYSKIKIPLPPIEVQKEIVEQIEVKQNAIDHAKAIIKNLERERRYFGQSLRKLEGVDWVELGEVCTFEYGKPLKEDNRRNGEYPVFGSNGIVGYHDEFLVKGPFIVVGRKGTAGAVTWSEKNGFPIDTTFYVQSKDKNIVDLKYLYHTMAILDLGKVNVQAGVPGLNRNDAYKVKIPLPSLKIQKKLVAEAEKEQEIIKSNKKLIEIMERKIEKVIAEI